jgi:formate/nitrite transporter FocA (FNT family)
MRLKSSVVTALLRVAGRKHALSVKLMSIWSPIIVRNILGAVFLVVILLIQMIANHENIC